MNILAHRYICIYIIPEIKHFFFLIYVICYSASKKKGEERKNEEEVKDRQQVIKTERDRIT